MMFGLPAATEIRRPIPKDALFSKFNVTGKEKNRFDSQIHKITVLNTITPETVNINSTDSVKSIHVIEVQLNDPDFDRRIIDLLNRMGHKAVYAMRYENRCKLVVMEEKQFQTEWKLFDSISLELIGLDLSEIWANFVRIIGGLSDSEDFDETIRVAIQNEKIQKQIDTLEKKLAKEKQNHVQRELYAQIQLLKKQLL